MQTFRALALIGLFSCATSMAQSPGQPGDVEVTLGAGPQSRLGISTMQLESAQAAEITEAIGRVLDIGPLAQLETEIESAQAAAKASGSETKRLSVLAADDQNASRRTLEAAQAQSTADAARLQLALQRLALEWGPGLASMDMSERRELVAQIAGGRAALLRVDPLEPVEGLMNATVRLRPDAGLPAIDTENLGPAATADAQLQSEGLLVSVRNEDNVNLRAGRILAAEVDNGRSITGVMLPRSALVRIDGATWAYIRHGPETFLRREVIGPRILAEGWFVHGGFSPGEEIVDNGAGSLLAVERGGEADDD